METKTNTLLFGKRKRKNEEKSPWLYLYTPYPWHKTMSLFKSFSSPVTKRFVERRLLQTNPWHLFRIIQDVDHYSSFLPLCTHSQVLGVQKNGRQFEATLTVGFPYVGGLLQETYVSRVQVNPEELTVTAKSIESHWFDSLQSTWKLGEVWEQPPQDNKNSKNPDLKSTPVDLPICNVNFEVEMTVRDPIISQLLDQILEEVAGRQVTAFEKRCREIPVPPDLIVKQ